MSAAKNTSGDAAEDAAPSINARERENHAVRRFGGHFALFVALRFFREGRTQSLLILTGVSVGVAVIIFLSALIDGLQVSLIQQTLGSQAHLVVRPKDDEARPVLDRGSSAPLVSSVDEKRAQRLRPIDEWPKVIDAVKGIPGVVATSPTVSGSAVALRGQARRSVTVRGVVIDDLDAIIGLRARIKSGDASLVGDGALIGTELAKELGVVVGDRVRVFVDDQHASTLRVQGVFDLGAKDVNLRWVLVPLRTAQTLFDLDGGISLIEARVDQIFEAKNIAALVEARTGLTCDSWMSLNAQLLVALQSQSSSSSMIQFFVILAVALGIASVLVVSVVQKGKEIGILRAMGASRRQILTVFLWQGAIVGVVGSISGSLLGAGLGVAFMAAAKGVTFKLLLTPVLFARTALIALVVGVVSAALPARRAARLDPAVAIRNG